MSIVITPIPSTIELAAPGFTLGTTNSAGTAASAVASDSTLLAFDTTDPAAVGTTAVGSATVASRRDHGHSGVAAITSTNDAIARYDGTAGSLQNYTSNAPTISDAGVISLTSGQITWPASVNVSADGNTLDDFEQGVFDPTVLDDSLSTGESQTYSARSGKYVKIGSFCYISFSLDINSIGTLTAGDTSHFGGFPFTAVNTTGYNAALTWAYGSDMTLGTAGYTPTAYIAKNEAYTHNRQWDLAAGVSALSISQLGVGRYDLAGFYQVEE